MGRKTRAEGVKKTNRKRSIFAEALIERPAHFQLVLVLLGILGGIGFFSFLYLFTGADIDRASLLGGMLAIVIASLAAFVPRKGALKPANPELEVVAEASGQLDGILSAEQTFILRIVGEHEQRLFVLEAWAAVNELEAETASCLSTARTIIESLKWRARELQRIRQIKSVKGSIRAHRRLGDSLVLRPVSGAGRLRLRRSKYARLPRAEWEQVLDYLLQRCEKSSAASQAA